MLAARAEVAVAEAKQRVARSVKVAEAFMVIFPIGARLSFLSVCLRIRIVTSTLLGACQAQKDL